MSRGSRLGKAVVPGRRPGYAVEEARRSLAAKAPASAVAAATFGRGSPVSKRACCAMRWSGYVLDLSAGLVAAMEFVVRDPEKITLQFHCVHRLPICRPQCPLIDPSNPVGSAAMREATLRTILLARAIEETDPDGRLIPLADRVAATHEALRETGQTFDPVDALEARARRLLQPLSQRHPSLERLSLPAVVPAWLNLAVVAVSLAAGLGLAALDGARRINILALPIMGVVAWNLLVYGALALRAYGRARRHEARPLTSEVTWLGHWLGRRLETLVGRATESSTPLGAALSRYSRDLGHATVPLFAGLLRRSLHLSAASLALGMLAGFYLRGVVLRFEAGWESTFLGASQAFAVVKVLYAPVAAWAGSTLPRSVPELEALRWTASGGGGDAAPWIHLIALSLALYVILPRLALAVYASFDLLRLRRRVPLPRSLAGYARSIFGDVGSGPGAPTGIVNLSLISHTNAGKTTLARTLLRRDVGEVRDAPHVTTRATAYELLATPEGDVLQLWDTPGFSGTERLAQRLAGSNNPIGWLLTQAWDRMVDRDFFLTQRALRNVRDVTDVVLYVVDASEDPAAAGYLDAEMKILGWMGKPVLVLLNQLDAPRDWQPFLVRYPCVRSILRFDAFARCWVQEHALLEQIAALLPGEQQQGFERIATRWRLRNEEVFSRSMAALAAQLAAAATDVVEVGRRSLGETTRAWLGESGDSDPALERAMTALGTRLDAQVRASMDELIRLHGLSGSASGEVLARMGTAFAVSQAADVGKAGVLGGAVTGALAGLAADLAAGGLTFGAGALLGGVLGAVGGRGVAKAYNLSRGVDASSVRWSADFLAGRVVAAVLRYLAVAHFGRGRGDFAQDEYPEDWRTAVETAVAARRTQLDPAWPVAGGKVAAGDLARDLQPVLTEVAVDVLRGLYPGSFIRP
jgi:hypothetical protein